MASVTDKGESEEGGEEEEESIMIPELPSGQELTIAILSTWGDKYCVGLSSIEVFTASGEMAAVKKVRERRRRKIHKLELFSLAFQISADPSDINVLPEYFDDPRVVQNLLDGVNRTRDDLHMWLAPFSPGRPHTVTLTFTSHTTLAMVRIWVSDSVGYIREGKISPMRTEYGKSHLLYFHTPYAQHVIILTEGADPFNLSDVVTIFHSLNTFFPQNYNKSRIHSYRGARQVEMYLDTQLIFRGEIAR